MRISFRLVWALWPLLNWILTPSEAANVCFMMYSMADNNLEFFLRQDLQEFISSPAIKVGSLTTWVYYDGRNFLGSNEDITEPLPFVYNDDGTPLVQKSTGSRYFRYDHSMDKMVVDTILSGEQNSDSQQVVYNFMVHALADCLAQGSTEFFMTFSSHGAGFAGFGGDDHTQRKLLQSNQRIISGIQQALADTPNAPSKLDVIGFDACLMSAFGALDEYRDVAKYVLASEATEPGHGWAYNALTSASASSALDLAKQIQASFLSETQGIAHQSPKTLSIVDTNLFSAFLAAWETLSSELKTVLDANNDPEFFAALSRARATAISFEGLFTDSSGTPSAMDIGSFLDNLERICGLSTSTNLFAAHGAALSAYNAMFVARGNGPGTAEATGMHIAWPLKNQYVRDPQKFNRLLFDLSYVYASGDAPNWIAFLQTYYQTSTPLSGGASVCTNTLQADLTPTTPNQLLLNPQLTFSNAGSTVSSALTLTTDYVLAEYGLDVTTLAFGRRLQDSLEKKKRRTFSTASAHSRLGRPTRTLMDNDSAKLESFRKTQLERRTNTDNLFYLLGGELFLSFDGSRVTGTWDDHYFFLERSDGDGDSVYVTDHGNGQKSFPVCYFAANNPVTSANFEALLSVADAKLYLGCIEGFVVFSDTGSTSASKSTSNFDSQYSLYVYDDNTPPQELPPYLGGQIVPVSRTYVYDAASDTLVTQVVGGFLETVLAWGVDAIRLQKLPECELIDLSNRGVMYMEAYDFDKLSNSDPLQGVDFKLWTYGFNACEDPDGGDDDDDGSTNNNGDDDDDDNSGSLSLWSWPHTSLALCGGFVLSCLYSGLV